MLPTLPAEPVQRVSGCTTRRKYCFTPAIDEEIRRAYHLYLDYNNRRAITGCARQLHVPRWLVNRRAAVLGLARIKEPEWSADEVAVLERWGHLSDAVLQRKLKAVLRKTTCLAPGGVAGCGPPRRFPPARFVRACDSANGTFARTSGSASLCRWRLGSGRRRFGGDSGPTLGGAGL